MELYAAQAQIDAKSRHATTMLKACEYMGSEAMSYDTDAAMTG
jgi:hypothetical protein